MGSGEAGGGRGLWLNQEVPEPLHSSTCRTLRGQIRWVHKLNLAEKPAMQPECPVLTSHLRRPARAPCASGLQGQSSQVQPGRWTRDPAPRIEREPRGQTSSRELQTAPTPGASGSWGGAWAWSRRRTHTGRSRAQRTAPAPKATAARVLSADWPLQHANPTEARPVEELEGTPSESQRGSCTERTPSPFTPTSLSPNMGPPGAQEHPELSL